MTTMSLEAIGALGLILSSMAGWGLGMLTMKSVNNKIKKENENQ